MTAKTAAKGGFGPFKSRTEICHARLLNQIARLNEIYVRYITFPRSAHDVKRVKGWQRYRKHYARVQYRNRVAEWGGR